MRHARDLITFFILTVLASTAAAATNKCTGADGEVIYTNTACQSGYVAKGVAENVSVVDASAARALVAKEVEKSKAQEALVENTGNETATGIPAAGGLTAANLAKLKEAESLAHTAIGARERMGLAAAILVGIAAIFMFFIRRKK